MDKVEALKIAYKNIVSDYKEFSGEDFNMNWDQQANINVEIWNGMTQEQQDRFYELNPKYVYDALAFYDHIPVKIHPLYKVLSRFPGAKILDFGCGTCCDLLALRLMGLDIDGVDNGGYHVEFGKWRLEKYKVPTKISKQIDGHYDIIYCYDVLEHLRTLSPTVDEICRSCDMLIACWEFTDINGTFPIHFVHKDKDVFDLIESYGFERDYGLMMPRLPRVWRKKK